MVGSVTREQIEALGAVAARLDAQGLVEESRVVRDVLRHLEPAPRELRAAAAAEILAVTPQTIRNWVRAGVLPGRRDKTGHFHIPVDALAPAIHLRRTLPDQPTSAVTAADIDAEIEAARLARGGRQLPRAGRR